MYPRILLFICLTILSSVSLQAQRKYDQAQRRRDLAHARYDRFHNNKFRSPQNLTSDFYKQRIQSIDDEIKRLEERISSLKKDKVDFKKEFLSRLDERIKMKDGELSQLKKERVEVQSGKSKTENKKNNKSSAPGDDSRKSSLDQEVKELKSLKSKVDSSKV